MEVRINDDSKFSELAFKISVPPIYILYWLQAQCICCSEIWDVINPGMILAKSGVLIIIIWYWKWSTECTHDDF